MTQQQFHLDGDDLDAIQSYLRSQQWIAPDERLISAKKPGEGNMNYTLRIRSDFRTFILKQSRDYVEKYPSIPAPADRAVIEGHFYETIQHIPELREVTPEINHIDTKNSVLMMEDLGESSDFMDVYQSGKTIDMEEIESLMNFLSVLHNQVSSELTSFDFSNREMRALNAEHIFRYPFHKDNGFDLDSVTPGLQEVSMTYKTDAALNTEVTKLSEVYLGDGSHLLHGDYYPGSWLRTLNGVKIIDPEFCFLGAVEFDLSVILAHTYMAELGEEVRQSIHTHYQAPEGFDTSLTQQLTGVEIMRRLIGLAQLPLSLDLEKKTHLLAMARHMILGD